MACGMVLAKNNDSIDVLMFSTLSIVGRSAKEQLYRIHIVSSVENAILKVSKPSQSLPPKTRDMSTALFVNSKSQLSFCSVTLHHRYSNCCIILTII